MIDEELLNRLFPNDPAPSVLPSAESTLPIGWDDLAPEVRERLNAAFPLTKPFDPPPIDFIDNYGA